MKDVDSSLYLYSPTKVAPIFFAVLFFFSTLVHIWQNNKYKGWRISFALPWGGLLFVSGFIIHVISQYNDRDVGLLVAWNVLILCACPVYELTCYLLLGRTLYYVPYLSPIHPGRVITTFLGLDVVVGILTGNGGARVADPDASPSKLATGKALLRASIFIQLGCFCIFPTLCMIFHRRCLREGIIPRGGPRAWWVHKVGRVLCLLYFSSMLIIARNIFRIVDVWLGYDSYVAKHEAFWYVFDGALMLILSVLFNVFHPMDGKFLPTCNKIYLTRYGEEKEGPGWVDKRPFLLTMFDPFDVWGLVTRRESKNRFWEEDEKKMEAVGRQEAVLGNAGLVGGKGATTQAEKVV